MEKDLTLQTLLALETINFALWLTINLMDIKIIFFFFLFQR